MPTDHRERYAALIAPHLGPLFRAAYRLCRNVPDAEDLVQEVCLRAYDRRAHLERAVSPRAWLLRVQFNLHVDASRRRRRLIAEPLDDERHQNDIGTAASEALPDVQTEAACLAERLSAAWIGLTPDQQALLALHAEGHSLAEMTEITGVPLGPLKARLHRARTRLGKLLAAHRPTPQLAATGGQSR